MAAAREIQATTFATRAIAIRRGRGEGENKTDPAKERFRIAAVPGGIMRNKINVTQSRLSFEISLPVLAADKCSIPTTCTRTPVPLIPRRPLSEQGSDKASASKKSFPEIYHRSTSLACEATAFQSPPLLSLSLSLYFCIPYYAFPRSRGVQP